MQVMLLCTRLLTLKHVDVYWRHVKIFVQRELEDALAKVCVKFDAHCYDQVQEAYRILGKTQV